MRHLTFLLLIIGLTTAVFGQQNKFDIGLTGGPSLTLLHGGDIIKQYHHPTLGYSSGLFFQYNFPKIFSLRTDIQYERKGSVFHDKINYPDELTAYFNFNYLTVPILARATIGKKIKYFANCGVLLGYLARQTFAVDGYFFPDGTSIEVDTKDYKPFDFGATAGIGLSIPIKDKFLISFEIRDNLGLYNVNDFPAFFANESVKTNSTNFLISFGYKFVKHLTETK